MQNIVFLDRATIGPRVTMRRPNFPHELVEYEGPHPNRCMSACVARRSRSSTRWR